MQLTLSVVIGEQNKMNGQIVGNNLVSYKNFLLTENIKTHENIFQINHSKNANYNE